MKVNVPGRPKLELPGSRQSTHGYIFNLKYESECTGKAILTYSRLKENICQLWVLKSGDLHLFVSSRRHRISGKLAMTRRQDNGAIIRPF